MWDRIRTGDAEMILIGIFKSLIFKGYERLGSVLGQKFSSKNKACLILI